MALHFITGNVLYPVGSGNKIIVHNCNNVGAWGGGFTKPLTNRWIKPYLAYKNMRYRALGAIQTVQVERNVHVVNMIGQVFHRRDGPPVRYFAIRKGLRKV